MNGEQTEELLAAPQPETITTPDGFIIDTDTGEVLRHIDEPFTICDRNSAEWALEKMQDADCQMLAEDARLKAISECILSRLNEIRRRRQWLQNRFGPELERYAAQQLASAKSRTLVLDHGKISFRRTAGSTRILNAAEAVAWAEQFAPDAVQTSKSVLLTPLKGRADLPPEIFEVTAPADRCTVETGIK